MVDTRHSKEIYITDTKYNKEINTMNIGFKKINDDIKQNKDMNTIESQHKESMKF